ncbi:uncharacterized protein LOC112592779, partial [Melanaphis sacchari]|uniref:uncharacterized protein LOC112592779 n=1 Tax=Melanaphis sacchari TaxID=742174 RepID=UPI000DC134E6
FIKSRMSSSISIQLLICFLIFLPSCCIGFKDPCKTQDRHNLKLCEEVSATKYKNWYRNLKIYEIEEEIQKNIERMNFNRFNEDFIITQISDHLKIGSSPFRGQLIDSQPSKEGNLKYRNAELLVAISRSIKSAYCLKHSDIQCAKDLSNLKLNKTSLSEICFSEYFNLTECTGRNLAFRSADGTCNNLKRSYLGKATSAYKRLLFPAYTDGIKEISELLPNPRKLSIGLVNDEQSPDNIKSMAMAYWGIFIGHDLSRTAVHSMGTNNTFVKCCNEDNGMMHYTLNKYVESCNPIPIPTDDVFYEPKLQSCMNYVRSVPAMRSDCTFGHIEQ